MSRLLSREEGFSLPELLVGMSLMTVVLGATLSPLDAFHKTNRRATAQNEAQDRARLTMDRIAHELRNVAGQSQSVEKATGSDLVFQAAGGSGPSGSNNSGTERVRYCLDGSSPAAIWKQTQTWTSAAPPALPSTSACPDAAWPTQTKVIEAVTNGGRAVWSYDTQTLTDIGMIQVDLYVDVDPAEAPGERKLSSGITLRNQNKAPTADFTATPTGNQHVQLDGSASLDPEGGALGYVWLDGSTQIGAGQTCDCVALGTGSRSIKLRVTDSSGLTGETTKTVNVL